uniref:ERI1 exoribonuclease 2 n=1 Tax=Gasterosteus aculeatus aculeatus TaxID=481459 RepID=G3Q7C4_GASAC
MSTKQLARELGLLRQRSKSSNGSKSLLSNQIFPFLIVIDFESTCWREKKNSTQEIIEFPAVLLNTSTGEIQSEFHTYVQPQEHPVLSEFCTELTGITQSQVEAGIPLHICLSRFSRWLQKLQLEMGVVFPNGPQRSSAPSPSQKPCAFVTWSDWDLGVCLQYECKRKQLHKPDVLNSWIDLRSTYRLFYDRKPKGLNGALQDLGIQFSGREHSGLDDSRNTAQLAARIMRDGCVMKITRSLEKVKPPNTTADNRKPDRVKGENAPSANKPPPPPIKSCSEDACWDLDPRRNSSPAPMCRSLISPKTLLNGTTTPLWGRSGTSQRDTEATREEELCVEAEERWGSYDDVVLQADDEDVTPKSSFAIFADPAKPSSAGSLCSSKKVLSSLSTNALPSVCATATGGQRITSPLCACGRRAKRQVVSNGGPNQGRGFYCCPVRRSGGGGGQIQKGCEFFKWESALMKSGSAPARGSSVSLCVMTPAPGHPPQRSAVRKSC